MIDEYFKTLDETDFDDKEKFPDIFIHKKSLFEANRQGDDDIEDIDDMVRNIITEVEKQNLQSRHSTNDIKKVIEVSNMKL